MNSGTSSYKDPAVTGANSWDRELWREFLFAHELWLEAENSCTLQLERKKSCTLFARAKKTRTFRHEKKNNAGFGLKQQKCRSLQPKQAR